MRSVQERTLKEEWDAYERLYSNNPEAGIEFFLKSPNAQLRTKVLELKAARLTDAQIINQIKALVQSSGTAGE